MLELIVAIFILLSLILYALMGGADFGGGMWDLLATGPRAEIAAEDGGRRHRPDLGGQPRVADPGDRAALLPVFRAAIRQ